MLELLEKKKSDNDSEEVILSIGKLMNESQISCQQDYECSCAELDEMITISKSMEA
ncbi:hypothetical protein H4Q26_004938 [Puccinia striiformis f. sp. tritici PST-130]|nr:hypothetical protein H4Q26_004938 [Puccinia striiformis f. sp. tritici PST-130]